MDTVGYKYQIKKKVRVTKTQDMGQVKQTSYIVYEVVGAVHTPVAQFYDFTDRRYHRFTMTAKEYAKVFKESMEEVRSNAS